MQINQLAADRQQLWTLPTFDGALQYDLGGAVPGTPIPGRTTMLQAPGGVMPASYSNGVSPSANAAVYGQPLPGHIQQPPHGNPSFTNGSPYQPMPQYGRWRFAPPSAMGR
jgi:hypothetical protein